MVEVMFEVYFIIVIFIAALIVILYIFRLDIKQGFKGLHSAVAQEQSVPSLSIEKKWLLDDTIIGSLTLTTTAETSKQAQANMDYLFSRSLQQDEILLKQKEKQTKEKKDISIG